MEWLETLTKSIKYIEKHILDDITITDISKEVFISSYYLQKGFLLVTGYSISEYIRNRRLYLAGLDICKNEELVIDIAYKYLYTTPESFTKAFTRFHGITPSNVKGNVENLKMFLPLKIKIQIDGGNEMNYVIEKMSTFKVIGFKKRFNVTNGYQEIPKFWDLIAGEYFNNVCNGKLPSNSIEKAILDNNIGELGVCIDDVNYNGEFDYIIGGFYNGGNIPEGLEVFEIEESEWIKFESIGPMPFALQTLNTKIYKEWLPNNYTYNINTSYSIEWYSCGDMESSQYRSAVWLPIKNK